MLDGCTNDIKVEENFDQVQIEGETRNKC